MKYRIEGIDCPNCALKLNEAITKVNGVSKSDINFMNKTLYVEFIEQYEPTKVLKKIQERVNEIEKGVVISSQESTVDEHAYEDKEQSNHDLIKLLGAILILIGSLLISNRYLKTTLILLSYIIISYDVIVSGMKSFYHKYLFNEEILMTIASLGALLIGELYEGVMVMLLYGIGEYLQNRAVDNTRKSLKNILKIRPNIAHLITSNEIKDVLPDDLSVTDHIEIYPGEIIPVDAVVTNGESAIDTSNMTGESIPRYVKVGDELVSGTINLTTKITATVKREYNKSTVFRILELVENASNRKTKSERLITKCAKYYTPIVIGIVILTMIFGFIAYPANINTWVYRALTILVVSCPCAIVIAVPLSYFIAIGTASKKGILVKGSNYLEKLTTIDAVVFDKTGTLTSGEFKVTKVSSFGTMTENEILKYAKSLERYSKHPIAKSIMDYEESMDYYNVEHLEDVSGKGMKAIIQGKEVVVGNANLVGYKGNVTSESTIVYVLVDQELIGSIEIADEIKPDAKKVLESLRSYNIKRIIMLSGDRKSVCHEVANRLGIDEYQYELMPEDKVGYIDKLKHENSIVFVGDGTNDAPVIRLSDVGISMGKFGSQAAIEAADVSFMNTALQQLTDLFNISFVTKRIVLENIIFSLSVKIIIMVLSFLGITNMWMAILGDTGVMLLSILNAFRIKWIK